MQPDNDNKGSHTPPPHNASEPFARRFTSRQRLRKPLWKIKVTDLAMLEDGDDAAGYDPYNRVPQGNDR